MTNRIERVHFLANTLFGVWLAGVIPKIFEDAGFRVRLFIFRARRDDAHGRSLQGGATLLWMKTDGL